MTDEKDFADAIRVDETFYVLEGELTFQLEDEVFTRTRGELAFAPRNVAHTFANLSGADARTLIVCTPAGFERYFDLIFPPIVSPAALLIAFVLAVFKPWGRIRERWVPKRDAL